MASLTPAPTTVHSNGMVVATGIPKESIGTPQNLAGGLVNGAAAKTAASIAAQSAHAVKAGVTMRGSGRKRRGGGTAIYVPDVPEGGTIPGVSFSNNHANLLGGLNQLRTSAVYDHLAGTQPYKVGSGRRIPGRDSEEFIAAGRKRSRKTKKNGRRHRRSSMGKRGKRTRRGRRVHRSRK